MEALVIDRKQSKLRVAPEWADVCFTCGTCAGGCPVTGVDGLDPRKAVRMAALGLDQELVDSRFPWICTLCGRCEYACPQGVEILKMMRKARSLRERDKVPGPIHKGVIMDLERGNNLGIPKDDFLFLLADSKEPFGEPDDLKFWWRIFYAAKEDWTVPSENWEGVNWGLFSGDDESMKTFVGRIVEHLERLECKTLLLPE